MADSGKNKPAPKRRTRRSKDEIVAALLTAAIAEFEEHGYERARTASIARRAQVVEPLLFKHFTSKFNLFQQAIFTTLDQHFRNFTERHAIPEGDRAGRAETARIYIGEQQDFLEKFSRMFMSLVVNESYGTFAEEGLGGFDGLQFHLDRMAATSVPHRPSGNAIAPDLLARIAFGTLLAGVLFRKWLFPDGMASPAQIREAIAAYVMKGADITAGEPAP